MQEFLEYVVKGLVLLLAGAAKKGVRCSVEIVEDKPAR